MRTPGATETRCELLGTLAPTYSSFAIAANPAWVKTPLVVAGGVSLVVFDTPRGALLDALDPVALGGTCAPRLLPRCHFRTGPSAFTVRGR